MILKDVSISVPDVESELKRLLVVTSTIYPVHYSKLCKIVRFILCNTAFAQAQLMLKAAWLR